MVYISSFLISRYYELRKTEWEIMDSAFNDRNGLKARGLIW